MSKSKKCTKWKHDFSYDGKKTLEEICCKDCGVNIVEWTNKIHKELEKKMYE